MTNESLFQAGTVALESTMLGLLALAILIALWMAISEAKDAAHSSHDDWDV